MDQLPQQRDADGDGRGMADTERWAALIAHRPLLMRVARKRTGSEADAEDCVSEALARAYEFERLDLARVQAFLCTTVSRLAVDEHRRASRSRAAAVRDWTARPQATCFEDSVLERAEGSWLADRLGCLRGRERALLEARMSGQTVAEYAMSAGISVKAAENAWTRIRHKATRLLAVAGALVVACGAAVRRPAAVAAPAAVALALTGFMFPAQTDTAPPAPGGEATTATGTSNAPAASERDGAASSAAAPARRAARPAARRARPPVPPVKRPETIASVPRSDVPAVASLGGTRVERNNEDETFEESVMRCLQNVDLGDPLADPCDY